MGTDEDDGEMFIDIDLNLNYTRLTKMVRGHYLSFLTRRLQENVNAWCTKPKSREQQDLKWREELNASQIQKCAELLEDKAIQACMVTQLYQRAMLEIIGNVRLNTRQNVLENELLELIKEKQCSKYMTKTAATQTEIADLNATSCNLLSLDQKIEMFQQHLNAGGATPSDERKRLHHAKHKHSKWHEDCEEREKRRCLALGSVSSPAALSSCSSSLTTTPPPPPPPAPQKTFPVNAAIANHDLQPTTTTNTNAPQYVDAADEVAKELAQMFSEEKTELDEIFGIDPNNEPDDPQTCRILQEIENASLPHEVEQQVKFNQQLQQQPATPQHPLQQTQYQHQHIQRLHMDLRNSLWPCELFMQRRRLSESLSRLIEEDLRWHELMKWKFTTLFGEDSDDEFAPCSPSIELNEELMSSCIRRITPLLVRSLMKPLKDGLIANRFLFKKLAKKLAHSIIVEDQYPDKRLVRKAVEKFFCLHRAVMSAEDLEGISSIRFTEDC